MIKATRWLLSSKFVVSITIVALSNSTFLFAQSQLAGTAQGPTVATEQANSLEMNLAIAEPMSWRTERGTAACTGNSASSLSDKMTLLWKTRIEGLGFDAGAVIGDGTAFVADADGRVLALDLNSGKEKWRVQFEDGFTAAPAYRDGRIYVGDNQGLLRALDTKENGNLLWSFESNASVLAGANFHDDLVLFTSEGGVLTALRQTDGSKAWQYTIDDQLQCSVSIVGSTAFLGGCDKKLHWVDLQNGTAARESTNIEAPTRCTPAIVGSVAYVANHAGQVFAFDVQSGEQMWKFRDEKLAREIGNSIAVNDQLVIVASDNRRVFALNSKNGTVAWDIPVRKRADSSPVIAGEHVLIAAADGRVLLLNVADGKEVWMYEAKGAFAGSPAVADGKVVLTTDRGDIYCFGTNVP